MIDSTDTMNFLYRIIQPNIKILLLVSFVVILMFQYLDTNIILVLSFILTIFVYHKEIMNTFGEIQKSEKRVERVIEDNKRKKKEIHFDEEINTIVLKLKKYRKYNINAYEDGYKYLKMFMFILHDLEKTNIAHPKQYFENAELYLKKTLNHFQSISISVPEETFNESLKYNQFEPSKLGKRIGKLCKRLHKHCYYLLFNLSLRLNKLWEDNPDIYQSQITMNVGDIQANDKINYHMDLY